MAGKNFIWVVVLSLFFIENSFGQIMISSSDTENVFGENYALEQIQKNFGEVDSIDSFFDTYIVSKNGKYALVSKRSGKTLLPMKFDALDKVFVQFIIAKNKDKYGIYDITEQKFIIPIEYQSVEYLFKANEIFVVQKNGEYGMLDGKGKQILPFVYNSIKQKNGLIQLKKGKITEYYSSNGKIIRDSINFNKTFTIYGDNSETFYAVFKNNKWSLINNQFEPLDNSQYEDFKAYRVISDEQIYLFSYKQNGKWGIKYTKGEEILPPIYERIDVAIENLVVGNGDTKKFYNLKTRKFQEEYDFESYSLGFIFPYLITKQGKVTLVDRDLKLLLPFEYEDVSESKSGYFVVRKNGKYGLVDTSNKVKIPLIYKELYFNCKENLLIAKNEKAHYGIISLSGDILLPFEYSSIVGYSEKIIVNDNIIYDCDMKCIENCP